MLFDPGACCTCSSVTTYPWNIWIPGCAASGSVVTYSASGGGYDGVTVEVYSDSGRTTLVASGTTDANGRVLFNLPGGTYYARLVAPNVRVSSYDPASVFLGSFGLGTNTAYRMGSASGYVCVPCCKWPIPTTLEASTPWGDVTLTYGATGLGQTVHYGIVTPSNPFGCTVGEEGLEPATAPLWVTLGYAGDNPSGQCTMGFGGRRGEVGVPLADTCANGTGFATWGGAPLLTIVSGTLSCDPFSATFSGTVASIAATSLDGNSKAITGALLGGDGPHTVTITVTE